MPISIGFYVPTTVAFGETRRYVDIKQNWSDSWTFVPWLTPIECEEVAAPDVGTATFAYNFGSIKREHETSFTTYTPITLRDYYVRIRIQRIGEPIVAFWHGVIADEEIVTQSPTAARGDQKITAYGLGHLLDRKPVQSAWVDESGLLQEIGWVPKVNKAQRNSQTVDGNRSTSVDSASGVHHYSKDGEVWTHKEYLEYVLKEFGPSSPAFKLAGATDVLDELKQVHDVEGMSIWGILNKLIDRRNGIGFVPITNGTGDIFLFVFTVTDVNITMGATTLPANANPITLNVSTTFPHNHLVAELPFRFTSINQFDTIEVRGERIQATGTWSYADATLENGWGSAEETDYITPPGVTASDLEANDRARQSDRLKKVYVRHRVPKSWNWLIGDGAGGGKSRLNISVNTDGTIDANKPAPVWNQNKRFLRSTPFEEGKAYGVDPPTDENPTDAEPEFRRAFATVFDNVDGAAHDKTDSYVYVDRLAAIEGARGAHIRLLDSELGFELTISPSHYFANGSFSGTNTLVDPEFDYRELAITATVETDLRISVTLENISSAFGTAHEVERKKIIDIPDAHYWHVAPGTIYDVDEDGTALIFEDGNNPLRDDRPKLQAVAAFAIAWYGAPRHAATLTFRDVGPYAAIGAMVVAVTSFWFQEPVRTPVTGRRVDFIAGTTTLETGWSGFDILPTGFLG